MAEKVDINKLIADAKKKADEARAAAAAAAAEAAKSVQRISINLP